MHCPDMKVAKKDMEKHFGKVLQFVGHLQKHAKGLEKLTEVLEQVGVTNLLRFPSSDCKQQTKDVLLSGFQQACRFIFLFLLSSSRTQS